MTATNKESTMRVKTVTLMAIMLMSCSWACSDDSSPNETGLDAGQTDTTTTADANLGEGERIFRQPVDDGNTFACSTCHALQEPAADGFRRVGHPVSDATRRPHYKNGGVAMLRGAVNSCLEEWMSADRWSEDDPRWMELQSWLDEQAPEGEAEPLSFEIVAPPSNLEGGDAAEGQRLFNESCAKCHGQDGVGTERAIPLDTRDLDPAYVARRVRLSGATDSEVYDDLTGGRMPFWAADRLSDNELLDMIAYLTQNDGPMPDAGQDSGSDAGNDTGPDVDDTPDVGSNCEATHERVGWTAELSEQFHNVGGTAEIIDNCTVRISNFTYDGRGINVSVYGAADSNYDDGYSMTADLVRSQPYEGETIFARLPAGRSLDDLDGVSVWCVDVAIDFGSGVFSAP
jgi:mono/diheme cytochrome c family protein